MHPAQRVKHALGDVVRVPSLAALNDEDEFREHGGCDRVEDGFDGGEEVYGGPSWRRALEDGR